MSDNKLSSIERAQEKRLALTPKTGESEQINREYTKHEYPLLEDNSGLDLGKMFNALWHYRGLFATIFLILSTMFLFGNKIIFPDKYEATASVRVKSISFNDVERVRSFSVVKSEILSNKVLEKVISDLNLTKRDKIPLIEQSLQLIGIEPNKNPEDPSGIIRWLKDDVRIQQEQVGQRTAVFTISLIDTDPDAVKNIVNSIVSTYLELRHTFEVDDSVEVADFLKTKLKASEQTFSDTTAELAKFQAENTAYLVPIDSIENNISRLQQEYSISQSRAAQLEEVNVRLEKLINNVSKYVISPNGSTTNTLSGELENLKTELAVAKSHYTSNHPTIKALENRIATVNETINNSPDYHSGRSINSEYLRLHEQIDNNEAERTVLVKKMPSIADNIKKLTIHLSRAKSAQRQLLSHQSQWDSAYNDYRLTREQYVKYEANADAQQDTVGQDMEILDNAELPTLPVSASRTKLMILGMLSAMMIAFVVIFIKAAANAWEVKEPNIERSKVATELHNMKYILMNFVGIIWFISLIGFIAVTPYL